MSHSAPLIIGATGGSGTRVVARLAQRAGYDLGSRLNESEDAVAFRAFHDKWVNPFFRGVRAGRPQFNTGMGQEFQASLAGHLPGASDQGRWGWKAPRTIYLLPFFRTEFADMKFIHVIRDGRDMAFSRNQNQLRKHGRAVLSWSERWICPVPVQSILLWDRVNRFAADYGESELKENYHRMRFEDLCQSPVETTDRLMRFLGAAVDTEAVARSEIAPPTSLGRWRQQSPELVARLERAAENSLRRFGYL